MGKTTKPVVSPFERYAALTAERRTRALLATMGIVMSPSDEKTLLIFASAANSYYNSQKVLSEWSRIGSDQTMPHAPRTVFDRKSYIEKIEGDLEYEKAASGIARLRSRVVESATRLFGQAKSGDVAKIESMLLEAENLAARYFGAKSVFSRQWNSTGKWIGRRKRQQHERIDTVSQNQ